MEISFEEFQRLADDKTSQAVRAAELERQLAEKTSECELLKCRVGVLEADNEKARIEILLLRNYITLSVEKIRAFMKRLNSLDRFAFLKTFLECALPKEHYQEQLMRLNEVMTIPDEKTPVKVTNNHYVSMTGDSASYTENNNIPDPTNQDN